MVLRLPQTAKGRFGVRSAFAYSGIGSSPFPARRQTRNSVNADPNMALSPEELELLRLPVDEQHAVRRRVRLRLLKTARLWRWWLWMMSCWFTGFVVATAATTILEWVHLARAFAGLVGGFAAIQFAEVICVQQSKPLEREFLREALAAHGQQKSGTTHREPVSGLETGATGGISS